MKLMIADEARDNWEEFEVIDIKREAESLVIVTLPLTFIVGPYDEFTERVIDVAEEDEGVK